MYHSSVNSRGVLFISRWLMMWRSSIQSAKTRPEADCGSDHEHLNDKFRIKMKVGKTSKPFRYDLNQIPYDYAEEVTNRFKGLDLMNYGWRFVTLYRRQGSRPSPRKRTAKKQNCSLRMPGSSPGGSREFEGWTALAWKDLFIY